MGGGMPGMALPMPPTKPKRHKARSSKGHSVRARKPHVKRAKKKAY